MELIFLKQFNAGEEGKARELERTEMQVKYDDRAVMTAES